MLVKNIADVLDEGLYALSDKAKKSVSKVMFELNFMLDSRGKLNYDNLVQDIGYKLKQTELNDYTYLGVVSVNGRNDSNQESVRIVAMFSNREDASNSDVDANAIKRSVQLYLDKSINVTFDIVDVVFVEQEGKMFLSSDNDGIIKSIEYLTDIVGNKGDFNIPLYAEVKFNNVFISSEPQTKRGSRYDNREHRESRHDDREYRETHHDECEHRDSYGRSRMVR